MSIFRNLMMQQGGWDGKPSDWSDIRKDCPADSIALYVAHPTDFSAYDNFGFYPGIVGDYNVFIDGVQYGTTYTSGSACSITWSTLGITTGDNITTPSAMKAHKIWIEPATPGNNFYSFRSNRVASSGTEEQGLLWAHFNFKNNITLNKGFSSGDSWTYFNKILQAVTAKNNIINISAGAYNLSAAFYNCEKLEYLPIINGNNGTFSSYGIFYNCKSLKKLKFKNLSFDGSTNICTNCYNLEEFIYNGSDISANPQAFKDCYKLKKTPTIANNGNTTTLNEFITNASSLEDTVFDFSGYDNVTRLSCYGSESHFMTGFKGLRVSNEAPFSYATPPQINISYTGMDRTALVQLFNSLPTVSSGQVIWITGCIGAMDLSDDDIAIAEGKGWSVIGGPAFQVYATFSGASVGDTIKLNDGMATSEQVWSAYPSDTTVTGSYTQTKTVTAVDGDLIECEKPTETSYTPTIETDVTANIDVIDNTTINNVTIYSDQTATIETSANVTTANNGITDTNGSRYRFNITVPSSKVAYIESAGISYQAADMPIDVYNGRGVGIAIKDSANSPTSYYINSWIVNKSYDLHYQQINFSYPSGATVTCKVNNVPQSDLTPYVYTGDVVTWTCDNSGTVTTGSYTVPYSAADGKIQTITIS